MKKQICLWFVLLLVLACAGALAAGASSLDAAIGDEADGGANQQVAAPEAQDGGPDVRWTFGVPLTALYAPECKLVNRDNLLDETFEPASLVEMKVKRATSAKVYLDSVAAQAIELMFSAAKEEGYTLFLKSGYRSYGSQKTMYNNRLESNNGKEEIPAVVAYPGSSEHQTGLACDILNADYAGRPRMTPDFSETAEAQWMKENCALFGFILSYPEDKTDITKTIFEPWHFRYVGKAAAGYIMREGLTMEEFTDEWQLAEAEFRGRGGDADTQMAYEKQRVLEGPESYVLDIFGEDGDAEVSLSF